MMDGSKTVQNCLVFIGLSLKYSLEMNAQFAGYVACLRQPVPARHLIGIGSSLNASFQYKNALVPGIDITSYSMSPGSNL